MTPAATCSGGAPASRRPSLQRRAWRATGRGVTLLELIIVMSLMAIIAAIAIPMLGTGVSSTELRGAARQIASALRAVRSDALVTRKETRLVLNLEARTFQMDREAQPHTLPKDVGLKLFTAQSDIVDEKVGAIRFFPDGGSNGGRITIAAGERKYEVDVDWLTGRVAILD